jgi:hypothetical protein
MVPTGRSLRIVALAVITAAVIWVVTFTPLSAAQSVPPVPKPFPQPGQQTPPSSPSAPATPATATSAMSQDGRPTDAMLGNVAMFPDADYLQSVDVGRGQRYYVYGTNAPFADVVAFFKSTRKTGGRQLFQAPAMQQFDLQDFKEQTMVMQPSIVVKDYTWTGSAPSDGYLFVPDKGTTAKRYKTIIQVVPPMPVIK